MNCNSEINNKLPTYRFPQSILEMTFICRSYVWSWVSVADSSSRRLSSRPSITFRSEVNLYSSRSCRKRKKKRKTRPDRISIQSSIWRTCPALLQHLPQTTSSRSRTTRAAPGCTRRRRDRAWPYEPGCTSSGRGQPCAASGDTCPGTSASFPRGSRRNRPRPGRARA